MEIRSQSSSAKSFIAPETAYQHQRPTIKESRDIRKREMADSEKNEIIKFLETHHGNVKQVAAEMGISRNTLYKKMQRYLT